MKILLTLGILFGVFYFILISLYIRGLLKISFFKTERELMLDNTNPIISLIIAIRNEENNIISLVKSLNGQKLDKRFFEVIFVNDSSEDNSKNKILSLIKDISNFKYVEINNKSGKKNAINYGISISIGKLIVTTDADCKHNKYWLYTILKFYLEYKPKLIIAPVLLYGKSFFQQIQSLEFLSLQASTAGATGINSAIMCNGANLAYEKTVFYEIEDALKSRYASGDDMFMLHSVKEKYPSEIKYLKNEKAIVRTEACENLRSFINQRIRWTSKSRFYKDFHTIISSVTVFIINVFIIVFLIASLIGNTTFTIFLSFFILKAIIDFTLMLLFSKSFGLNKSVFFIAPILIMLYPFYIALIPIISIFTKKYNWKNRNVY